MSFARLSLKPARQRYKPTPIPPEGPAVGEGDHATAEDHIPEEVDGRFIDDDVAYVVSLGPKRSIAPLIAVGLAAATVIVAAIAAPAVFKPAGQPASTVSARPVGVASQAAPSPANATQGPHVTSRAWSLWHAVSYNALQPIDQLDDIHRRFQPMQVFPPGYEILDGATVQSDQTRIHLVYLAALPPETICMSAEATKFACGLMARASLSVSVSGAPLSCYPDVSIDSAKPAYICQSRGRDIALAQLQAGFALPANQSVAALVALAAEAHARHAGAWNGDWTILQPGGDRVPGKPATP